MRLNSCCRAKNAESVGQSLASKFWNQCSDVNSCFALSSIINNKRIIVMSNVSICSYCSYHNLPLCPLFDKHDAQFCKCCGTNMNKDIEREKKSSMEAAEMGNEWGGSMPLNIDNDNDDNNQGYRYSSVPHHPTILQEWLPDWLNHLSHHQGFTFNCPESSLSLQANDGHTKKELLVPSLSTQVARLWKRSMPKSSCWQIRIPHRAVAFDIESGKVAGAVYFDVGNKYIACVCVDENFRRRNLGSTLVILAVAISESSNPKMLSEAKINASRGYRNQCVVSNARPNLCVSPKDLVHQPHLHEFYEKLGFKGGKAGIGGNYVLSEQDGYDMLSTYSSVGR